MQTRLDFPAYLQHIEQQSARFTEALAAAQGDEQVPPCPDWKADDLLYHLGEVQTYWSRVVGEGAHTQEEVDAFSDPERAGSHEALIEFSRHATARLLDALRATDPAEPRWTWSDEQTAGFTYRRQAHEAMIHRLDAELTTGRRTPLDPALATDGVDEVLKIMFAGCPPWGSISPHEGHTLLVHATDTGAAWLVTLARFTGTNPKDGKSYDEADITVADAVPGDPAAATISGTAADLDCWLWHRPGVGELSRSGDADVLREVEAVLAHPLN
jgi:uncharacterized protein (TIGR03083 family)